MGEFLNKFFIWLREPDSDRILIKLWRKKRDRDKAIEGIEAKRQAEEYRQKVKEQAYLLWEADGKQEGKDEYYWKLAVDKVKGNNIPCIYQLYYWIEKHILEPTDAWIKRQASISILSQLAILAAIVAFIGSENTRRNNEIFNAWQTITSANTQSGSGGRIEALEFLNSRPLKFPWIGWTEKEWYWDEGREECKEKRLWGLRWKRQTLVGLSATIEAYLAGINLCGANLSRAKLSYAKLLEAELQNTDLSGAELLYANLSRANLQNANLSEANLQGANLEVANLQDAYLWEANLQKADLAFANLQNASLREANLQKANLFDANLQDAYLFEANLQDANLGRANLQKADLFDANLQKADLFDANLQDAYLFEANLQDAYLGGANLQKADLRRANLQGAILIATQNLIPKQIKSTCFWDRAIYRGEWDREEQTFIATPDNADYIEELRNDTVSDLDEPIDCSRWEKEN